MNAVQRTSKRRRWLMPVLALAILVPSLWGFGTKFLELIHIYQGDAEGAFAVAPITNYLLASSGFLLLFLWAAANGMFHDIERPKYTMLENERRLDAGDRSLHTPSPMADAYRAGGREPTIGRPENWSQR